MRHQIVSLLVVVHALAACHVDATAASNARPSKAPVLASATPAPVARVNLLLAPPTSQKLTGTLAVDASYIALHGGSLITQDGASIVAIDGSKVVTHDGGSLITNDGGSLLSSDGRIIAQGGGNVVVASAAGKATVADNGSSIIAQGGGNIIAQGGGNIAAQSASRYRLAASASAPPPGTILPAAGMLISVVDLATNQYLSLGKDASGKNVYAVYSNAKGGYEVYLPKMAGQRVMVVASGPGSSDGRLTYNLLTPPSGQAPVLDEYSSLVTHFLRVCFARRLKVYVKQNNFALGRAPTCPQSEPDATVVVFKQITGDFLARLGTAARDGHVDALPDLEQNRITSLMNNYLVARMPAFNTIATDVTTSNFKLDPGVTQENALEFLAGLLKDFSDRARDRLRKDPAAFDALVARIVANVNQNNAHSRLTNPCSLTLPDLDATHYRIEKPTDLAAFMVEALLADGDTSRAPYACELFEVLGLVTGGDTNPNPGPVDDAALNAALDALEDTPKRPSVRLYRHMVAGLNGFVSQIAFALVDPAIQCQLLNEIEPGVCQSP